MPTSEVFLRRNEVMRVTGQPCSTLYARMAEGSFPKPVRLSPRSVAWRLSEVEAWQQERIEARDAKAA
jgi:prophage regulatory protein